MRRKYLVSPQGVKYREGKVYANLSGNGYSDIFIFGKNQIVNYGVSKGGAVDMDVFEGEFKYSADGRAGGRLKKISLFSAGITGSANPYTESQIRVGLLNPDSTLSNFSIGDITQLPVASGGGIRDLMKKFEEYRKFLKPLLAWEKSPQAFSVRDLLDADAKQLVATNNIDEGSESKSLAQRFIKIDGLKLISGRTYTDKTAKGRKLLKFGQNALATDKNGERLANAQEDPITGYRALNALPKGATYAWEFEFDSRYLVGTAQYKLGNFVTTSRVAYRGNNKFSGDRLTGISASSYGSTYVDGVARTGKYSGSTYKLKGAAWGEPFTFKGLDESLGVATRTSTYDDASSTSKMTGLIAFENGKFFFNNWDSKPFSGSLL